MNTARYIVALVVVLAVPPGYLLWFAIHPFVRFWRRLGAKGTYWILMPLVVLGMMVALVERDALLGHDFGTHYVLLIPAAFCLGVGVVIGVQRKRHLKFGILAGVPELSASDKGCLLREGIYGKIRHPRYIETVFMVAAYALFANYSGSYVVAVVSLPVVYLIVLLEEKELEERFGQEYVDYCGKVPRFLPRRAPPNSQTSGVL